jgi:hypothetical protein
LDSGHVPDAGSSDAGASDAGTPPDAGIDAGASDAGAPDAGDFDSGVQDSGAPDAGLPPLPFGEAVVSFMPGPGAGYGQDKLPGVVLGPPQGAGNSAGSTDVLSLGKDGVIVLETGITIIDGPGVDLLVFENPFAGFIETGFVAVSEDGGQWFEFPCAAPIDGGTEGCAGVNPVYSNPSNGISPTDPTVAGGDGFDLAQLGVARANYVRIRDSGVNHSYAPPTGGFDLDAISVVHGIPR